jgi:hypothetical protein
MLDYDFFKVAVPLGILGIGLSGLMMSGVGLFGEDQANRAKKNIPTTILGIIITAVASSLIMSMFG